MNGPASPASPSPPAAAAGLHLSRVRLSHAPSAAALAGLLLPGDDDARIGAAHRLVWSLFADRADRERDFLWREEGADGWSGKTFLILSARPPRDGIGLFEVETKPFAPALRPGQRLGFRLRASAVANEARPGARGRRVDPLAKALKPYPDRRQAAAGAPPETTRAAVRHRVMQEVGSAWLARQAARSGFRIAEAEDGTGAMRSLLTVDGDRWHVVPREGAAPVTFPSLDFEGTLVVEDPDLFLAALARGFGRAKAFGCGLMLIRPG